MSVNFDPSKMIDVAKAIGAARLEAACVNLVNQIRKNLSAPGRTKTTVVTKSGASRTKWGAYGSAPSAPGDFPAKQRGTLRSSIAYTIDKTALTAKVGTSLQYGKFLEMGTHRMAARPWLLRTWNEQLAATGRILAGK